MHSAQHACNEFVDTIALLYQGHKRRYPTFVVRAASEMCKYEFLKSIDLVLKNHEVCDSLVSRSDISRRSVEHEIGTYPSLGSLMDLRLMYSSYSNNPAPNQNLIIGRQKLSMAHH